MKAIILAGGEGKRLRPLTDKLPKSMMPVMNRPLMEHFIRHLCRQGITEIGVMLGYRADMIEKYFGDGRKFGVKLTYFREAEPQGTIGGLRNAAEFLTEDFIVAGGSILTDLDLNAVIQFHKAQNAFATLVLKETNAPADCGIATAEPNGKILHFADTTAWNEATSRTVCTGICVMKPEALSYLPLDRAFDLTHDLIPLLLEQNRPLFGFVTTDYWCNVTDIGAYRQCHKDVFLKKIDLSLPEAALNSGILIGENCTIGKTAVIKPYSVIGNDCIIGDDAAVQNAIIWPGSTVPQNAEVFRTVCYGTHRIPFASIGHDDEKHAPSAQHNCFEGIPNDTITPEFLIRLTMAVADVLPKNAKILLSLADDTDYLMIKFAMLAGVMASGATAYHLVDCGDRSLAKFALRKLSMDAGIHAELTDRTITLEILDANGASMNPDTMNRIRTALSDGTARHAALKDVKPPVNVNRMPLYYFKDLLLTTVCKRLNFSVVICCSHSEMRSRFKKICTAFGISAIFTNEVSLVPNLILKNHLDVGLSIGQNGKYALYDENGEVMSGDTFYALAALIVASAFKNAEIFIPRHASDAALQVASACDATLRRVSEEDFEAKLLQQNTRAAALEYDLCFDPIRCLIRICEFLYINNTTLGQMNLQLPKLHKVVRQIDCPPQKHSHILQKLLTEMRGKKIIDVTDGIKIVEDRGWIVIMPDVSGSRIQIHSESRDAEFANELAGEICGKLEGFLNE